jgi:hypothetical protein
MLWSVTVEMSLPQPIIFPRDDVESFPARLINRGGRFSRAIGRLLGSIGSP